MNHHYRDIRSRISDPPKWFDEFAVPRYCDFKPDEVANIYASEVALAEIRCQDCGTAFMVAFAWGPSEMMRRIPKLSEQLITGDDPHYGDPPNTDCCCAGPTMNSELILIAEFWGKGQGLGDGWEWTRRPELEGSAVQRGQSIEAAKAVNVRIGEEMQAYVDANLAALGIGDSQRLAAKTLADAAYDDNVGL